ncbi:MAG: hypothetical protein K8S94_03240 [Planctomycetia bacterium]|nr:hypothetical protein [Planctomycetia bacterium]
MELTLATVVALLPVTNPPASAPAFLALTEGSSQRHRHRQLLAACLYMVAILMTFLVTGSLIMRFFGISIPGLRIAGGLMVAGVGSGMLTSDGERRPDDIDPEAAAVTDRDIAFSPLQAVTKIMGFLLLCIGIQFIVNGVLGIATDASLVRSIRDAIHD